MDTQRPNSPEFGARNSPEFARNSPEFARNSPEFSRIRRLLDPLERGTIPRRAVVSGGLIRDRCDAPECPELDAVSEVCACLFPGEREPREPATLLVRAVRDNIESAWQAILDDVRLGHTFQVSTHQSARIAEILCTAPTVRVVRAASVLMSSTEIATCAGISIRDRIVEIVGKVGALESESANAAMQTILDSLRLDASVVARCVLLHPHAVKCVLTQDLGAAYSACPSIVDAVESWTRSLPAPSRVAGISALAVMAQRGVPVRTSLGIETLREVSRSKFDVRLAVGSAILVRLDPESASPDAVAIARVIESLATTLQTALSHE